MSHRFNFILEVFYSYKPEQNCSQFTLVFSYTFKPQNLPKSSDVHKNLAAQQDSVQYFSTRRLQDKCGTHFAVHPRHKSPKQKKSKLIFCSTPLTLNFWNKNFLMFNDKINYNQVIITFLLKMTKQKKENKQTKNFQDTTVRPELEF